MGQGSLFGGWEATRCEISFGFHPNQHSGWMHVTYLSEHGSTVAHRHVSWRKERDLAGLPDAVKRVVNHWLYGVPEELIGELPSALSEHCPPVPDWEASNY